MSGPGFDLLLPFDTQEPEFARGFECGRLWELLKGDDEFEQHIHAGNAEMVLRIAAAAEREVTAEHLDDEWMLLKAAER